MRAIIKYRITKQQIEELRTQVEELRKLLMESKKD